MRAGSLETKMIQEENIHENESKCTPTAYCTLDTGQGYGKYYLTEFSQLSCFYPLYNMKMLLITR